MSQVSSALCIICISGCYQSVYTISPGSNKYGQVSASIRLSNDVIASLLCFPNERRTKDNLFNLFNVYMVTGNMIHPFGFNNKFVDSHKFASFSTNCNTKDASCQANLLINREPLCSRYLTDAMIHAS